MLARSERNRSHSFSSVCQGRKYALLTTGPLFSTTESFPEHLTIGELNCPDLSHLVARAEPLLASKLNTALPQIFLKIHGHESEPWLEWGASRLWAPGSQLCQKSLRKPRAEGRKRLYLKAHLPLGLAGCYSLPRDTWVPWGEEPGGAAMTPGPPPSCGWRPPKGKRGCGASVSSGIRQQSPSNSSGKDATGDSVSRRGGTPCSRVPPSFPSLGGPPGRAGSASPHLSILGWES